MPEAMNLFTKRYDLALKRVLKGGPPAYTKEFVLADSVPVHVRRFTEFSGDVSGRWIGALSAVAADRSQHYPELKAWLPDLLAAQRAEGYFGEAFAPSGVRPQDMAVLWGNGRLLIGLLEYHLLTRDGKALASARKLGDFLLRIAPEMNSERIQKQFAEGAFAMGYICWTQTLEGLVKLYQASRNSSYLNLARQIAARIERRPNEHSHGFLTSLRGVMDLYEATGEKQFLEQVKREWQGVIDSGNLLAPGAVPEAWKPKAHRTEGCSEADWLRLSLQLWKHTRDARYLEATERTLFNEFAMNQFNTGDFGHRVLSATGSPLGGNEEGGGTARAWWCCTLHGLRTFPDVRRHIWRRLDDALAYDLPLEGEAGLDEFRVQAESALEQASVVRIRVLAAGGRAVPLMVREPAWVWGIEISANGLRLATLNRDGYHRFRREWKTGDVIEVKYLLRTRVERDKERVSIFHGPWLLGIDEARNPYFFDEPHRLNRVLLRPAKDGTADLEPDNGETAHDFAVPAARFRIPYAPGGYPAQPATARLRPVAEQTGFASTAWEYWFRLTEKG